MNLLRKSAHQYVALLSIISSGLIGCSRADQQTGTPSIELKSGSFAGGVIPSQYASCGGQDGISPELSWSNPPEPTQGFAVIAFDEDSPFGLKFTHWVLYDLPADSRNLPENVPKQAQLADGSRQGPNDYDKIGYVGPCPPRGQHHYLFTLYALDTKLNLPPGASRKQLLSAMKGHILASGELIGLYQH